MAKRKRNDELSQRELTDASGDWPMAQLLKVPLLLHPQPEGGYTATSPALPELVTEGETVEEALENVRDALGAVIEVYEDLGRALPGNLRQDPQADPIWFEHLVVEG